MRNKPGQKFTLNDYQGYGSSYSAGAGPISLSYGGDDPNQETHRFNPANMGSTFTETGGVLDGKAVLDPKGVLKTPLKESISIMWSHTKTSFF